MKHLSDFRRIKPASAAMKEKSSKTNYRINPVSGRDTGSVEMSGGESMDTQDRLNSIMTAEEQQIAEIMSQSREDVTEKNTISQFREALNSLIVSFNFEAMNIDEDVRGPQE